MSDNKLRMVVQNIRLSYAYLAEPAYDEDKDTYHYRTMVLISKKHPQLAVIRKAIQQAAVKKFGLATAKKYLKNPKFHLPLRDPEVEDFEGEAYNGNLFFNTKTNVKPKPGVILKNGTRLATPEEISEHVYSGVWGNISVTFFGFDQNGNKGVAVALNNFMKTKDGEHLDGSVDASDEFQDLIENDDDNDLMGNDDMGDDLDGNDSSDDEDWDL